MTDCLRQFILSINQLQMVKGKELQGKKVKRYLKKMAQEWKTGSIERHQSEEAFLKIVTGGKVT